MVEPFDPDWVSAERFAEYQEAAGNDAERAGALYEWNVRAASALFEMIGYFEVLFRNAVVRELDRAGQSPTMPPGTPWVQSADSVDEVVSRLKKREKPVTPGRVYAGLTFGFWRSLFVTQYEELWRHSLKYVFRHGRVDRQVIAEYLESVNQVRNTIAHHGSLLELDIVVEAQKIKRLVGWIDPKAAVWLDGIERVTEVANQRPVKAVKDTLVVRGTEAWDLYTKTRQSAFLAPPARSYRIVEHLAFYSDGSVQRPVPRFRRWFDAIDWNAANARRLDKSDDLEERELAKIIRASRNNGWNGSAYQVFLLSAPNSEETEKLPCEIAHTRQGRGSAFVKRSRYVTLSSLRSARDTADII